MLHPHVGERGPKKSTDTNPFKLIPGFRGRAGHSASKNRFARGPPSMAAREEDILPSSLGIPEELMQARTWEEANAEQGAGGGRGDDKGGQEERESEQSASWLRRYRMYTHTHAHTHTHYLRSHEPDC